MWIFWVHARYGLLGGSKSWCTVRLLKIHLGGLFEMLFSMLLQDGFISRACEALVSRACEALGWGAVRKTVDYVSDRTSFFSNMLCLSNFRESARTSGK